MIRIKPSPNRNLAPDEFFFASCAPKTTLGVQLLAAATANAGKLVSAYAVHSRPITAEQRRAYGPDEEFSQPVVFLRGLSPDEIAAQCAILKTFVRFE